jgi:hypothetical protein
VATALSARRAHAEHMVEASELASDHPPLELWVPLPDFFPPPCLVHRPVELAAPLSHPVSSHHTGTSILERSCHNLDPRTACLRHVLCTDSSSPEHSW